MAKESQSESEGLAPISIEQGQREPEQDLGTQLSSHNSMLTTQCFAFVSLGLFNNTPYVIMLAAAKNMDEGGVAVVYLANILPALLVKLSLPYWMERVSYHQRLLGASLSMAFAFFLVGFFSGSEKEEGYGDSSSKLAGQLVGVAAISFQCALGEASLLALAGKIDAQGRLLTSFSSGTGIAGPFGYLWKIACTEWLGWTLQTTCFLAAVLLPSGYYGTYYLCLHSTDALKAENDTYLTINEHQERQHETHQENNTSLTKQPDALHDAYQQAHLHSAADNDSGAVHDKPAVADMSPWHRFRLVASFWPYIIPLFSVYAAEYACQGGVWTAIGFGSDDDARTEFYERANWLYQAGVFVSRSSGNLFSISLTTLWILPACQVLNLIFFYMVATHQWAVWFYHPFPLYSLATITGFMGGAVYVHGYQRILKDIHPQYTEFALSSVSVAEALGVLVATVMSLFLQACLYKVNGYPGAMMECPF